MENGVYILHEFYVFPDFDTEFGWQADFQPVMHGAGCKLPLLVIRLIRICRMDFCRLELAYYLNIFERGNI